MTRLRPLLPATVLVVSLATACASSDVSTARPANPDAAVGGSISIGIQRPQSIDPGLAFDPAAEQVVETICDTLLGVDPESGDLVAGLVESWVARGEGTRFLLRLRDGATFHDGTAVTPRDVVWSLNRLADPEFASPAAGLLDEVSGFAEFRGAVEAEDDLDRRRLRGVREGSEGTVEVLLAAPNADWLATLTHPATSPVSRTAAEADAEAFREQPACAGPYRVVEPWTQQSGEIMLERFADYHGQHGGWSNGGAGYLDEVTFELVADPGPAPEPAAAAEAPMPPASEAPTDSESDAEVVTEAEDEMAPVVAPPRLAGLDVVSVPAWRWDEFAKRAGMDVVTATGSGVDYVGLPVMSLSGGDEEIDREERARQQVTLRRALSLAIDREEVAREAFFGGRAPATGFVPVTVDDEASECAWLPARGDAARARELFEEAGVEVGTGQLELLFSDDFRNGAMAEAVAAQWRRVLGLDVVIRGVEFPQFLEEVTAATSTVEAFRTSWAVPVPSRDAYLFDMFHSSQIGQGNLQGFADFAFDELLDEDARRADDDVDRDLLYDEAEAIVCDQVPIIPVTRQLLGWAVAEDVAAADGPVAGGHRGQLRVRELYRR